MARFAITHGGEGSKLWKLLAKAAGVDHLKLRRIVCTCERASVVRFDVELMGEEQRIADAIPEQEPKYTDMSRTE